MSTSKTPKVKAVILDFDGTIADSFAVFIETVGELLNLSGKLSDKEINDLRGKSTRSIMKQLHVHSWQLPRLMLKGRQRMAEKSDRIGLFKQIKPALDKLSQDYKLYILSSNSDQTIKDFLEKHRLDKSITRIYGGSSMFGKAKYLKRVIDKEGLTLNNSVYVGDETRDIEAARDAGVRCVAVGWGYSTKDILEAHEPDALALSPKDLKPAIDSL